MLGPVKQLTCSLQIRRDKTAQLGRTSDEHWQGWHDSTHCLACTVNSASKDRVAGRGIEGGRCFKKLW